MREEELVGISEFFAFFNTLVKLGDSPAAFESYHFYKERVLVNYKEEQLKEELIEVDNFADLLPGNRVFWVGSIVTEKRSVELRVKVEAVLNIGNKGNITTESIKLREVEGLSAETSNKSKKRWLQNISRGLIDIAIRLISAIIARLIINSVK